MRNSWLWEPVIKSLLDNNCLTALNRYKRIIVGYSGGLDSTVLLHNLAAQPMLLSKLNPVHINHGLSPNALAWQSHCQQFCQSLGLSLTVMIVHFDRSANIEESAREARYQAFDSMLDESDCLILGHHLDDQAETLLLQLFRGAGVDGLAAMTEVKQLKQGQLLRPLLVHSRQLLEDYAQFHHLAWIEDESNQDSSYSRNFLRHELIPSIKARWPAIARNLVRTATHCQQAQSNLDDLARIDCPALNSPSQMLDLNSLGSLTQARLSNVIRYWLRINQVKIPNTLTFNRLINELIEAGEDAKPLVAWDRFSVRRYQQRLYLLDNEDVELPYSQVWHSFPETLDLGKGLGQLSALPAQKGLAIDASCQLEIRFRQGGEVIHWHGQRKQLKKLLQDWQIPPWLRDRIPLLYVNGELAAVIDYAISDLFYQTDDHSCFDIVLNYTPIPNAG